MATKTKQWSTGTGSATIEYTGQGDGQITITSDPNSVYEARTMQITVETTDGSGIQRTITIQQAAKQRIDISAAVVTAATQTYNGSAKTPTPTVTLNGNTVPSSGYDVNYSNNTNAGTATITVTGKGDYTGTAYGTFTINKAAGVAGVSGISLTYSRNAQNLVTVSGNTGTVHYRLGTSGSWSTSIPTSTNAGTYTIYYYVDASTNYNAVGSSSSPYNVSTTIAKRTPVLSTSPSARTGLSYTGSAQNLLSGGAMKHSSSNSTSVAGTFTYDQGTSAGDYSNPYWYFTPNDTTNYNSTSGYISGTVTISKVAASVTAAPTAKSLTYNRGSQSLVNAGTASGGTMYYYATTTNSKPSSTSSFSSSIPTKTSAGTYYVWYYVKGDSNHTNTAISSTSVSVTIYKATPVLSTAPSKRTGLSYTGSAQNLLSGGSVKHSSSDSTSVSGTFTYAQGTNAGTYSSLTWSFTPSSSSNYNSISGTVSGSVTIAKASRTVSFSSPTTTVNKGSSVTNSATVSAGSSDGTLSYSSSNTSVATVNSSGKVTGVDEGSVTITASISEGANYLAASGTYTISVNVWVAYMTVNGTGITRVGTFVPGDTYRMIISQQTPTAATVYWEVTEGGTYIQQLPNVWIWGWNTYTCPAECDGYINFYCEADSWICYIEKHL